MWPMDFTYPSPEIVNMKAVSGAIIILAGAMLCGAGAIAEAISTAGNRYSGAGAAAMIGGVTLGLFGVVIVIVRDRPPLGPP